MKLIFFKLFVVSVILFPLIGIGTGNKIIFWSGITGVTVFAIFCIFMAWDSKNEEQS